MSCWLVSRLATMGRYSTVFCRGTKMMRFFVPFIHERLVCLEWVGGASFLNCPIFFLECKGQRPRYCKRAEFNQFYNKLSNISPLNGRYVLGWYFLYLQIFIVFNFYIDFNYPSYFFKKNKVLKNQIYLIFSSEQYCSLELSFAIDTHR
jgi:hypothetical protein